MAESVSNYDLKEPPLGQGSFGIVYLAYHKKRPDEAVAIKRFYRSSVNVKLLVSEIGSHKKLKHVNIVAFKEQFEDPHCIYIARFHTYRVSTIDL